jgi:hypothetical protein
MPDNPIPYPLDPVSVSGTLITLDQYVNSPTVMTRVIAEIAGQEFYAHRIFSAGPGVEGGALLFERPNPLLTDLYAGRRLQEMAPGTQAPLLTFVRGVPMVAVPREVGGKFELTKQERKRNNPILATNAMTQIGNTVARDLEIMALSELNAVISATTRTFAAGSTLAAAAATTFSTKTASNQPAADIATMVATVHNEQRGRKLNSALYNTLDWAKLQTIFGVGGGSGDAGARAMLAAFGITNVFVSVQQTATKAKFWEEGQVGVWSNEFPLDENTWEDPDRDRLWTYQVTVSPTLAVTDQFAMIEMTGL